MSPAKVYALPAFHAPTGCDNTSFFFRHCISQVGPKARSHNHIKPPDGTAFCTLFTEVNKAHQQILAQLSHTFEYLPPTKEALIEHIKIATYQACYVWGKSLVAVQVLPSPGSWGWVESECGWQPFWTPLRQAAKALEELVSCGCTKSCAGKCSCYKISLVCTARCKCGGTCYGKPRSTAALFATTAVMIFTCSPCCTKVYDLDLCR